MKDSQLSLSGEERAKLLDRAHWAMIEFDRGDPKRIQHFVKVHAYARQIALAEGVTDEHRFVVETAAYVHDIGIHVAEEKYGYQNGRLQELEGPAAAQALLAGCGFPEDVVAAAMELVAHHHTYDSVASLELQILIEADFIVNLFEDGDVSANRAPEAMKDAARRVRDSIFKTASGIRLINTMFGL